MYSIEESVSEHMLAVLSHMNAVDFTMKEYQRKGLEWMVEHEDNNSRGFLLSDDPGLGKTIQIASLLMHNGGTTLLVVPTSIVMQWTEVLQKINPTWKIYVHVGPNRHTSIKSFAADPYDICITTIGTLIAERYERKPDSSSSAINTLVSAVHKRKPWYRVVVDEIHVIRNAKTIAYRILNNIQSTYRIGLSGTPIQNSARDLLYLLAYMGIPIDHAKRNLNDVCSKYVLRRNKTLLYAKAPSSADMDAEAEEDELQDEVEDDDTEEGFLPYVCENIRVPFASVAEQDLYRAIQQELVSEFNKESDDAKLQMLLLEIVLRLRQATAHPAIAAEAIRRKYGIEFGVDLENLIPCKFQQICELLDSFPEDDKCIVFCQFTEEIIRLQQYLTTFGIDAGIFNGSMNIAQKDAMLRRSPRVLIMQTRCGGVGLNLQQYNRVIIMSPDWNPANEIQGIARSHRIGQTKQVYVYRLLAVSNPTFGQITQTPSPTQFTTIDERIFQLQISKKLVMVDVMHDSTYMDISDTQYMQFTNVNFKSVKLTLRELKYTAGILKRLQVSIKK